MQYPGALSLFCPRMPDIVWKERMSSLRNIEAFIRKAGLDFHPTVGKNLLTKPGAKLNKGSVLI